MTLTHILSHNPRRDIRQHHTWPAEHPGHNILLIYNIATGHPRTPIDSHTPFHLHTSVHPHIPSKTNWPLSQTRHSTRAGILNTNVLVQPIAPLHVNTRPTPPQTQSNLTDNHMTIHTNLITTGNLRNISL